MKRGELCRYLRKNIPEKKATEDEMVGWYRQFIMDVNLGRLQEMVRNREAWRTAAYRVTELDMT